MGPTEATSSAEHSAVSSNDQQPKSRFESFKEALKGKKKTEEDPKMKQNRTR